MTRIIRVFPRRTRATPIDEMAFVGGPTLFAEADEIHISVTFSWDIPEAERLLKEWKWIAPVMIGGPALGMPGGDFVPGMYLKKGYVITSRGCPNRCWFCSVWKREGQEVRELPITDGWNILDDNLLACSEKHIRDVFKMLKRQIRRAEFTGGLEAARLEDWHINLLVDLRPKSMYFAYDTDEDYEPLVVAISKLHEAGFNRGSLNAYVLIGYPRDTFGKAEKRLRDVFSMGVTPMAMLWKDYSRSINQSTEWKRFQRLWARPEIIGGRVGNEEKASGSKDEVGTLQLMQASEWTNQVL